MTCVWKGDVVFLPPSHAETLRERECDEIPVLLCLLQTLVLDYSGWALVALRRKDADLTIYLHRLFTTIPDVASVSSPQFEVLLCACSMRPVSD